jgi:predicted Rdx family selenoprotein
MHKRDYQEIAQAIWEASDSYGFSGEDEMNRRTRDIAKSIADVMFNDNPDRFDEEKFMKHAINGVDGD